MSTQSKHGILAFVDRYDRESIQALRHAGAEIAFERAVTVYMGGYPSSPILIAVGPEGGEKLCQYIDARGLDGVRGIGLVGVTAPWCEWASPKSLGPIEPLHKVAELARVGEMLEGPATHPSMDGTAPNGQAIERRYPLRLIVACAPDDGVCCACKGRGRQGSAWDAEGSYDCPTCDGSGKALSSADVARELGLEPMAGVSCGGSGGLIYLNHPTRDDLAKHGLSATLELAVKE